MTSVVIAISYSKISPTLINCLVSVFLMRVRPEYTESSISYVVTKLTMFSLVVVLVSIFTFSLYRLYTWALPRPIPGIPFDKAAKQRLLGNVPDVLDHVRKTGRMRTWFTEHNLRHQAVLTQAWIRPFSRPTLFLADFRESQDILLRRNKEFDRGQRSVDLFAGPVPNHHIAMLSSDPCYKRNKKLIRDLMTPRFLQDVAAPRIYAKAAALVNLWTLKLEINEKGLFSAGKDISDAAIDIIQAVSFGLDDDMSTIKRQFDYLTKLKSAGQQILQGDTGPAEFPRVPPAASIAACFMVGEHAGSLFKSLFPKAFHHFKVLTNAQLRRNIATKEEFIRCEINKTVARFQSHGERSVRSAMDSVLLKESDMAASEKRKPDFHSRAIYDELFGFFVAGYDTSTCAFSWLVKDIAENQRAQTKLRSVLWDAFPSASAKSRQPSATEISSASIPYLDAVIEETLRLHSPIGAQIREAIVDTELLGHRIPKGTNVFMIGTGPDFLSPSIPVLDSIRSDTSQNKYVYGAWDPADMHLFNPERWIKVDEKGTEVYDHQAGPFLSFGLGPRGCSGRRLAYLELRIVLVLLIWNFEFHQITGEIGSYTSVDKMTTNPKFCYVHLSRC
ncbi:cytochrome P450 [Xylaria digitata]|nr:cytochrome P450 [Xylaria digitata]